MAKKKEKEQITPEEMDLDTIMEEGMEKFDEALKDASSDTSEPTKMEAIGPAQEKESAKGSADKSEDLKKDKPDKEITLKEETKEKTDEKKEEEPPPGKEEEPKKKEEKKEYRFESYEKAEDGYRNLQGEKTRVDQENKRLKEEINTLQAAEKYKEDSAVADEKIMEFAIERHKESLIAIDALDPDDEKYQDDVAKIWAKKDRDIRHFEHEYNVEPVITGRQMGSEKDTDEVALEHVQAIAQENDIDPNDELFVSYCTQAPTEDEDGVHIDFEKQVDWAVKKTKNYLKLHEKQYQERQKAEAEKTTRKNQEEEIPLGRSTSDIVPEKDKEENKQVSLDDALETVAEERRL